MMNGHTLAVAGIQGSGKTTLARGASKELGWSYVAESPLALKFLPDLFEDQKRWASEAQFAFFCNKAISLVENTKAGNNVVLDRSLYEDRYVFARYWYEHGLFDKRSYETYCELADHFFAELPPPTVIVLCRCPLEVAEKRVKDRGKEFQKRYPEGHLQDLQKLYDEWSREYVLSPMYAINSELVDFTQEKVLLEVCAEIRSLLSPRRDSTEQLDLFDRHEPRPSPIETTRYLVKINRVPSPVVQTLEGESTVSFAQPKHPRAYVAAPFTSMTESGETAESAGDLFRLPELHGAIAKGAYRRTLLAISRALESMGLAVVLPHRDVNMWGKKQLTPSQVVRSCFDLVLGCDLFVGILAESHGSHYEYGIAQGASKAAIIIHCEELAESFINKGIQQDSRNLLILRCRVMKEIPPLIRSHSVKEFVDRHVFS